MSDEGDSSGDIEASVFTQGFEAPIVKVPILAYELAGCEARATRCLAANVQFRVSVPARRRLKVDLARYRIFRRFFTWKYEVMQALAERRTYSQLSMTIRAREQIR